MCHFIGFCITTGYCAITIHMLPAQCNANKVYSIIFKIGSLLQNHVHWYIYHLQTFLLSTHPLTTLHFSLFSLAQVETYPESEASRSSSHNNPNSPFAAWSVVIFSPPYTAETQSFYHFFISSNQQHFSEI